MRWVCIVLLSAGVALLFYLAANDFKQDLPGRIVFLEENIREKNRRLMSVSVVQAIVSSIVKANFESIKLIDFEKSGTLLQGDNDGEFIQVWECQFALTGGHDRLAEIDKGQIESLLHDFEKATGDGYRVDVIRAKWTDSLTLILELSWYEPG